MPEGDTPRPEIHAQTQALLRHLQAEGASNARGLEQALGDIDQIGPDQIEQWIVWANNEGLVEPTGGNYWNITDKGQAAVGPPEPA
jgi:hypothetical protein